MCWGGGGPAGAQPRRGRGEKRKPGAGKRVLQSEHKRKASRLVRCAGGAEGDCVCAHVCVRRMCVKSHPSQLPGRGGERGREVPAWRAEAARRVSPLQKRANLGAAARGAAPRRPPR